MPKAFLPLVLMLPALLMVLLFLALMPSAPSPSVLMLASASLVIALLFLARMPWA